MEQKTIRINYLGYSVTRHNVDEMTDWLIRQLHANNRSQLLWITPNSRKTLKAGDMIVVDYVQEQLSEGEKETFFNHRVPLAVYSSSNIHRTWSRGRETFMGRGVRILTPRTSTI